MRRFLFICSMFIKNSVNLFESDSPRRFDSSPQVCASVSVFADELRMKTIKWINNNNGRNGSSNSKKQPIPAGIKAFPHIHRLSASIAIHTILDLVNFILIFSPMLFLSSKWMRSRDFSKILNVILYIFLRSF